jgi:hypothetical protein
MQEATGTIGGVKRGLDDAQRAAVGLASAFLLREGIQFLKSAATEAEDATKALNAANVVFGDTPGLMEKISESANDVGIAIGKDNDEVLKLATNIGARLSPAAQGLSVDLVNAGADVAALVGVDIDTWSKRFSKAMVDGSLTVKEMQTSFPGLTEATYLQAEAMFEAGDQAAALNLIMAESQKVNGDAAEGQVTSTQKIDLILKQLSETVGLALLPALESFANFLGDVAKFAQQNKDILLPLLGILGGLAAVILTINIALTAYTFALTAWKAVTSIGTGIAAAFNAVMALNPFVLIAIAVAALVAGLIYFFTQTKEGQKIWSAFTKFLGDSWNNVSKFLSDSFNNIVKFFSDGFKNIGRFFSNIKTTVLDALKNAGSWLVNIGANIINGLLNGLRNGFKAVTDFVRNIGSSIMGGIKSIFGIRSPSREMAKLGKMINDGLAIGLEDTRKIDKAVVDVSEKLSFDATANYGTGVGSSMAGNTYNITVQAIAPNSEVGRTIVEAINEYERTSGRRFV